TLGERDELLAEANRLPDRVAQLGEEARGEEHARLVRQRYLIARATKVIDEYRRDIDAQQAAFTALAEAYRAFHTTEQATSDAVADIVARANEAGIEAIPVLQQELTQLIIAENEAPEEL